MYAYDFNLKKSKDVQFRKTQFVESRTKAANAMTKPVNKIIQIKCPEILTANVLVM